MSAALPPPAAATLVPENTAAAGVAEAEAALEWTFNPWRQDLGKALVGALMTVAIAGLIASLGLPLFAAVALTLAVLATVHASFLPIRCRVDEMGVARRLAFGWERRPWGGIRKAWLGRRGLFVSPRLREGVLASFQGLWLPVSQAEAPALMDELRRRLVLHGLAA